MRHALLQSARLFPSSSAALRFSSLGSCPGSSSCSNSSQMRQVSCSSTTPDAGVSTGPVHKLHATAKQYLNSGKPLQQYQVQELCSLAATIPLDDLGFTDDLLQEPNSYVDTLSSRHPLRKGLVTYLSICEDPGFTLGIFLIPPGKSIPLHDHPGMTVFSRLLFGTMTVRAFDFLDGVPASGQHAASMQAQHQHTGQGFATPDVQTFNAGPGQLSGSHQTASGRASASEASPSRAAAAAAAGSAAHAASRGQGACSSSESMGAGVAARMQELNRSPGPRAGSPLGGTGVLDGGQHGMRPAVLKVDRTVTGPAQVSVLYPKECNVHELHAHSLVAFLDILTPPYDPDAGRDCTYYEVVPEVGLALGQEDQELHLGDTVLLRETPAEWFVCERATYHGVEVDVDD